MLLVVKSVRISELLAFAGDPLKRILTNSSTHEDIHSPGTG